MNSFKKDEKSKGKNIVQYITKLHEGNVKNEAI
jgi:hypothetical protein